MARICNDAMGAKTRFYVANSVKHCTSIPGHLINTLVAGAPRDSTLVFNNAGSGQTGTARRNRDAKAGVGAFFTPSGTGTGTALAGRQRTREFAGRGHVQEHLTQAGPGHARPLVQ
jgi:acyl CoA:acetate/3-ketoacid CoA transferase alpha subunit